MSDLTTIFLACYGVVAVMRDLGDFFHWLVDYIYRRQIEKILRTELEIFIGQDMTQETTDELMACLQVSLEDHGYDGKKGVTLAHCTGGNYGVGSLSASYDGISVTVYPEVKREA